MEISTILLMMFAGMFLVLRVIIAMMTQSGLDLMGMVSWDLTYEIVFIFVALICLVLIAKRSLIGSLIYFGSYSYYFGIDLYNRLMAMSEVAFTVDFAMNVIVDGLGILIALCVLLDTIFLKVKKGKPKNQKTDWFFDNKDFDRKFDERADRNEYKF